MQAPLDFDAYFSQFPVRIYKKHWHIINAGDNVEKIYYIKKGYVRLYSISSEGKELTLIIYKPGEFFPLIIALEPKSSYPYFIEAMTEAEIISVPIASFTSFFKNNSDLLLDLAVKTMRRLDRILRRLEYASFGNAYQKIASIFIILAEAFGEKEESEIVIQVPLTHRDIALIVGITRETASIEIKKLEQKNIIARRGRTFVIKNYKRLQKEAFLTNTL